ncbi:MAG TPA: Tar ligand binding domain-containing protein, partial [Lacunisphaera sp.]|nr:Tar ligand binding domain-containing protein [Lacunisphaera sp.]
MKNWTISARITLGGILLLSTLLAVVASSLLGLSVLDRKIDSIHNHVLPGITAIGVANSHFMNCYSALLIAKERPDANARRELVNKANQHLGLAKERLDAYEAAIEQEEDRVNFAELGR